MKTIYTFHVSGTHCASCKIFIEDTLLEQPGVSDVHVDLKKEIVSLSAEEGEATSLAQQLTEKIQKNGYSLSVEKIASGKDKNEIIWQALPIGLLFLGLFFAVQKSGILNLGIGGQITPGTSFVIGIIASLSSCLAVVGGLVLSLSAKIAEDEKGGARNKKPFYLFHIGRLASFATLGGVLGFVGEKVGINFVFSALLGISASLIMVLLGLNLVGVFKKNNITLPLGIFTFFRKIEHETITPLLVGVGTFFLPCGFTQSMQVASLSSGSFASGSLIMLFFALGTLPMLSLLSFGSSSFAHSKHAPLFFKTVGVVVIGFGLFSLLAGLAGLGIISPLFTI